MRELLNSPSWIQFIGDRGIRTTEQARNYILSGPMEMYTQLGFGHYAVERKEDNAPIGICGLIKRDYLNDVDLGYAFLPNYWGGGYAFEAASAIVEYGKSHFQLPRIVAITMPNNYRSIKMLEKLGFQMERLIQYGNEELMFFAANFHS